MSNIVTVAVAGFGLRAQDYTAYQFNTPNKMKVVAISDIDENRLNSAAEKFNISNEYCFSSAEVMLEQPRLADAMFITTQDRQHVPQAIKALEKGYHILLEKPISPTLQDCLLLQRKAHKYDRIVTVCHVMRYTNFYQEIKKAIDSGIIGDVKSLLAVENVGYFHHAHSFVRGNWRRSDETSPMILAKSCHDLDLIQWLIGAKCIHLSSFGNLSHFNAENAPAGSVDRCLDGCHSKEKCPYDAEKIYVLDKVTGIKNGIWKWPCNAVVNNPTVDSIYEALKKGPYGRCVYKCDNNVVDHQVVIMEFDNGTTANFTMSAFTVSDGRQIKIMGTLGEIIGDIDTSKVRITPFGKKSRQIDIQSITGSIDSHAGGDHQIVDRFINTLSCNTITMDTLTSIDASVHSHVMALAAEHSRLNNGLSINLNDFINSMNH
ncbi:Gfo/Idh/MocA family protein [Vallitalea okinawensis]|uniref:Gfo/Idh/MocA family protein n=1 Tax=Vallitalea okinawensis TaxID=2078660 RepID=UPI000CFDFEA2|nr:Gfo/Idh/MocA family oxidoreductase [Vallitalea okinawensis]